MKYRVKVYCRNLIQNTVNYSLKLILLKAKISFVSDFSEFRYSQNVKLLVI